MMAYVSEVVQRAYRVDGLSAANPTLTRLRRICLALPQATEQETWGEATFRVRGKIFVVAREDDDGTTFSCKAPPGNQRGAGERRSQHF